MTGFRITLTPVRKVIFALAALVLASASLLAQEPQLDEGGRKLVLKKIPDIEQGVASLLTGTTGAEGDRFYVEHLTMFQPAMVVLMAADVDKPLRMKLAKFRYDEIAWTGETGDSGAVSHPFRTQGEVKIEVEPVNPEPGVTTAYSLIVWAAELPAPDLPPPAVLISDGGESAGIPTWLKIGGGVAVLAVVALVFFRMGRKS